MKKTIYLPLLAAGMAAMLAGCDENAWNDKLDGFDPTYTHPGGVSQLYAH